MNPEPEKVRAGAEISRRSADGLIGRTLGEFVIREKLGEGGFGTVFRAEQPALAREAVVKVLQPRARVGENAIQRFMREARLASSLDHPYAAHIYAFGAEPDGLLWIAMELVRGTPLDRLLKAQGPLPLARLVPLFDRICEVVQTAHEQGIVHRDLKPANVMVLSRAGRLLPKLLDFGVAKLREHSLDDRGAAGAVSSETKTPGTATTSVDEADESDGGTAVSGQTETLEQISGRLMRAASTQITQRGLFIGSPHYMAPEQWVNPTAADQRSDLYALGVLCFEALTGRHPFEGNTILDIARGHARRPVPSLGSDLPEGILPVLRRAMAKKSADRFQSALELATALRSAAGLSEDPAQIPQLDEAVRETAIALAPQPLAESVSALEASRTVGQALEAVAQAFRAVARYMGVIALACRTKVGAGSAADSAPVLEHLAALRRRGLADRGWFGLARELCRPFAQLRDAHPIPELVSFFFERGSDCETRNAALLESSGPTVEAESTDERKREILERELARLAQLLRSVAFLFEYPLLVACGDRGESWMGVRRSRRNSLPLHGARLPDGQALLVDGEGAPVVSLWPLAQPIAPTPGAPEELFLLEGNGRLGAKLVAIPLGFERHDEQVWEWFGQQLLTVSGDVASVPADEKAPYLGLATFTANDTKNFFGREREAEAFANRLRVQPMLAVVGPSGAGKSSFIQAGVVPLLPNTWRAVTLRPGSTPLAALCARLSQEELATVSGKEQLLEKPELLGLVLREWAKRIGGTVLLIVDQFEELLTLCPDPAERNAFAKALVQAAMSADDPIRVVLTLRDDFLIRAQQIPALRERLAQGLQLLATPALEDLLRILITPARQVGYEFEDAKLPEEMVREVAEQPGALALLSFTASKLWDLRDRHFQHLSRKAYQSLGGVGGALAQHAESTLGQMLPEQQLLVREAFRHLVTADRTRAVLSRREMEQVLGGGPTAETVLERLIGARLLTASEGVANEDRIEVIHEALLASWPRLVAWQQEDAENARMRHQLRAAARQWDERGRGKGLLWRKEALMEYRLWRSRYPGRLTETEEGFASASVAEEARGRRARRAALISAFVILAVGLAVLFRANRIAQENAREAKARLAMNYEEQGRQLVLTGDPLRAIVYLDKAFELGASGPSLQFLFGRAIRALQVEVASLPHADFVREAHFSPDGARAVTASLDRTAKLWDARSGKLIAAMKGHQDRVFSARFNNNGTKIVTMSWDGTAKVWDGSTGGLLATLPAGPPLKGDLEVMLAVFSDDGALIATTGADVVKLWRRDSLQKIAVLEGHTAPVISIAFHPDGSSVYTGSKDGTIKRWNLTGRLLFSVDAHKSPDEFRNAVSSLSVSKDGKHLASAGLEGTAKIWDAETGKLISTARDPESFLKFVAFNPDGETFVTLSDAKVAKIWNARSGDIVQFLEGHTGALRHARYSANGQHLLTSSSDGTAKLWRAVDGVPLMTLTGHTDTVFSVDFAPDEARIITASYDGTAKIWDTRQGSLLLTVSDPELLVLGAWSSNGNRILVATEGGIIKIWDASNGKLLSTIKTEKDKYQIGAQSSDERRLALSTDQYTRLLELPSGRTVALLKAHTKRIYYAMAFSPDSKLLALGSTDHGVTLWDTNQGKLVRSFVGHSEDVRTVAFDPTSQRLATGGMDKKVFVWDVSTGSRLLSLEDFRGYVKAVAFSPDGKRLVTASRDKQLIVWDAYTGRKILSIEEAKWANVNSIDFDRGGNLLLTSDVSGTAAIWDAWGGRLLSTYVQGVSPMDSALISPDGQRALTSINRDLAVWDVRSESRTPAQISAYVRCRVPFRLEAGKLVQTEPSCGP